MKTGFIKYLAFSAALFGFASTAYTQSAPGDEGVTTAPIHQAVTQDLGDSRAFDDELYNEFWTDADEDPDDFDNDIDNDFIDDEDEREDAALEDRYNHFIYYGN